MTTRWWVLEGSVPRPGDGLTAPEYAVRTHRPLRALNQPHPSPRQAAHRASHQTGSAPVRRGPADTAYSTLVASTKGTRATVALTRSGVPFTVHPYTHDPAASSYGLEAAQALGVDPGVVFKTLVVQSDSGIGLAMVPVAHQLDLKAAATAFGWKRASMAPVALAERVTGYVVGGVSPIGTSRRLPSLLDASATEHARVFVSGGRRGLDIGLTPADLVIATGAQVCEIARTT